MGIYYAPSKGWQVNYEPIQNLEGYQKEAKITVDGKTATVRVADSNGNKVNVGYWDVINALNAAGIPNPEPWNN